MRYLITGSSRGLGKALIDQLSSNNNEIVGISRSETNSTKYQNISLDLNNLGSLRDTLKTHNFFKKPFDLIFFCAGSLGNIDLAKNISWDSYQEIIKLNVFANKLILDHNLNFIDNQQKLIFISSGASLKGYTGWLEYCSTKSMADSMLRVYARENKNHIFCSFSPGAIDTDMQTNLRNHITPDLKDLYKFIDLHDNRKLRSTENAAKAILYKTEELKLTDSGSFFTI